MKSSPFLALILFLSPSLLSAEIVHCGGVWTNGSCDEDSSQMIRETESGLSDEQLDELKRKRALLYDFTGARIEAEKRFSFHFNASSLDEVCFDPEVSYESCRNSVDEYFDRLEKRIALHAKIEASREEKQEKVTENSSNAVVVIHNEFEAYRHKYLLRPRLHTFERRNTTRPKPSPRLGSGEL